MFIKCIEINPNYEECLNNLANSYEEKDMYDDAIETYQKCLNINPNNEIALYNIGLIQKERGEL